MKKNSRFTFLVSLFTLLSSLLLFSSQLQSQVVLARWTFPTGNASDSLADGGIPANLDKAIHTEGGTSAIDFTKNGATTKAAQVTGWDNGNGVKCWVIKLTTTGYENLKVSSKMQSGGNNPGPQDYKVQYRIGTSGIWTDIPGTAIITANNWTTGWLDSVPAPAEMSNQPELWLRWIMTSNTSSSGGTVASTGINKIDDIYITGKGTSIGIPAIESQVSLSLSPNPVTDRLKIHSTDPVLRVRVFAQYGVVVREEYTSNRYDLEIDLSGLSKGIYLLNAETDNGSTMTRKIVIR